MNPASLFIEADHIAKAFGGKPVLTNATLHVPQGAVVGLLGANGSGKSTLLKCLLGLLKCNQGTARLLGENSWTLSDAAKQRLGYVPQEFRLYPWLTVQQILTYTASFYPQWDREWVAMLVERWQLPLSSRLGPLSAGQLQKLALVLALGHRPQVLILDEPVASLDPLARREFLRSLLEMIHETGSTVLFSTHITSDIERVASHVAMLQHGEIAFFEELDGLKDRFKRLRMTAPHPLPRSFAVPGALHTRVDGTTAVVTATAVSEPFLADLKTQWDADVTVEDLNLEDIFVELH